MMHLRVTAALLLAASFIWAAEMPDCRLVPGWEQQGNRRSFVADNLFEYMDGNAEGYLIYQFLRMQGVTCQSKGDSILIDVSEMADPESAYGIFAANRDPRLPSESIGMGGQVLPRKAVFCKDKYYVELTASVPQETVLRAFVAAMEKLIPGRTAPPEALGWFPAEKLVPDSVRLVPESVLGMRLLKRGYIAQYESGKAFLVPESSPQAAAAVMEKLRARIGAAEPAKMADEGFQAVERYLGRLCVFRKGRYVGGFVNVSEGQDPLALASALAARIP